MFLARLTRRRARGRKGGTPPPPVQAPPLDGDDGFAPPPGLADLAVLVKGPASITYRARDEASDDQVRLRVFRAEVADPDARRRFRAELLATVPASGHPCLVTLREVGFTAAPGRTDDVHPYLVTDLFTGASSAERLFASGPLPPPEVAFVGVHLAAALDACHRRGLLHLHVTPEAVLTGDDGTPVLDDLGVTRALERVGALPAGSGDLRFAPRELYGWEQPGPTADVYGLGATLYTLVTGAPPYQAEAGRGPAALYEGVLRGDPAPILRPDTPAGLEPLVRRMMAPEPGARPPLSEVDRLLRTLSPPVDPSLPPLDAAPAAAGPVDDTEPRPARRRRTPNLIAAAVIVVTLAVVGTVLLIRHDSHHATAQPAAAHPTTTQVAAPLPTATPTPSGSGLPDAAQEPYLVSNITLESVLGHRILVTWRLPPRFDDVSGYVVHVLNPAGPGATTINLGPSTSLFVLHEPPAGPQTCVTVTSLIKSPPGTTATTEKACR